MVKGVLGSDPLNTLQTTSSFVLTLKNPCIDPTFVKIEKVALPKDIKYTIYDYNDAQGYTFMHESFIVATQPLVGHSLCGELDYAVFFENLQVTSSSRPMKYDSVTRTFDLYSEDLKLLGLRSIQIQGFFKDYINV